MIYLTVVQIANVFVETGIIFDPLILNYGTAHAVDDIPRFLPGDAVMISVVSAPIQIFTAWRLSVVTQSYLLSIFISILSLISFGSGMLVTVVVSMRPAFSDFTHFTAEINKSDRWTYVDFLPDLISAGDRIKEAAVAIETGTLTAFAALADMSLFLIFPNTTINFILDFPLSNLYTLSVLTMLNSRPQKRINDVETGVTAATTATGPGRNATAPLRTAKIPSAASLTPIVSNSSQNSVEIYKTTETIVRMNDIDSASHRARAILPVHDRPLALIRPQSTLRIAG
ncbi:unnamed protein product [Mycena citricolor]|uniref:DUF6534 domain-containing protein n=1 Tax=Mycena citricolor TaxID=2018698 RepID=A0AAD2HWC4_9AGAR|nr:unnamed protein product [Mycena citricolor]